MKRFLSILSTIPPFIVIWMIDLPFARRRRRTAWARMKEVAEARNYEIKEFGDTAGGGVIFGELSGRQVLVDVRQAPVLWAIFKKIHELDIEEPSRHPEQNRDFATNVPRFDRWFKSRRASEKEVAALSRKRSLFEHAADLRDRFRPHIHNMSITVYGIRAVLYGHTTYPRLSLPLMDAMLPEMVKLTDEFEQVLPHGQGPVDPLWFAK